MSPRIFACSACAYSTHIKCNYDKHTTTIRHTENTGSASDRAAILAAKLTAKSNIFVKYICRYCDRTYGSRSGLFKHERKCVDKSINTSTSTSGNTSTPSTSGSTSTPSTSDSSTDNSTVLKLIDQNTEIMKLLVETKTASTTINNNTNTNNTNTNFNLQVFLNEECKDAMNIMDFVASIKYRLEDLERIGRTGYVEGISNLMIEGLNRMELTHRPFHCTDAKRDSMYIRDNDEWQKDPSRERIRRAIKHVANNNFNKLPEWQQKYPDHTNITTPHHKEYVKMVNEVSGGGTDEEDDKNFNRIIKRVAAETVLTTGTGIPRKPHVGMHVGTGTGTGAGTGTGTRIPRTPHS